MNKLQIELDATRARAILSAIMEMTRANDNVSTKALDGRFTADYMCAYEILRMHNNASELMVMMGDVLDSIIDELNAPAETIGEGAQNHDA